MSSRLRAVAFAAGALACAGLSAALAGSATGPEGEGLDELRPVAVVAAPLERGTVIGKREVAESLAERRVPVAFAPPDALALPAEALGRKLAAALPPGSYLSASDFATGADRRRAGPAGAPRGTTPVEITVSGAEALQSTRSGPGSLVDVVVAGEPGPAPGGGRTYVAAEDVSLLALREAQAEPGLGSDRWVATLALDRAQALRLIRAEAVARSIRLLAG